MARQVNAQFSEESFARLQAQAERMGLTVSALARVAVTEYLDEHERGTNMSAMLVGWTVNGMSAPVGPAKPGQVPGDTANGTVLRITSIPDGITAQEVVKAVEVTIIHLSKGGPFDIPWEMLGEGKIVTADRLAKHESAH